MTLTSNQLSAATPRRARLIKICRALPEVGIEPGGDGHLVFAFASGFLLTTSLIIMATA
jgi:hypothetical protein